MNTYVIPWMSKEETEHFLRELKETSRAGKDQTADAKPTTPLPCFAKPDSEKSSSPVLDLGCL